jgi:hypothetical protein
VGKIDKNFEIVEKVDMKNVDEKYFECKPFNWQGLYLCSINFYFSVLNLIRHR